RGRTTMTHWAVGKTTPTSSTGTISWRRRMMTRHGSTSSTAGCPSQITPQSTHAPSLPGGAQ
ncbi:MAG TPA: hypothetical protein PKV96_03455, partial [Candidatus Saccharimonas sp.]|nr:hypothetical protein [Candidatus Saccharimonas sp.]